MLHGKWKDLYLQPLVFFELIDYNGPSWARLTVLVRSAQSTLNIVTLGYVLSHQLGSGRKERVLYVLFS